jgi:alkaline phosphatase
MARLRPSGASFILFLLVFCALPLLARSPRGRPLAYPLMPDAPVRNVVLFIGDGMGLAQLSASRMNLEGADGWYAIECMPVTTLVRTNSADDIITDSAAGATALATGHKTNNRMLSISPDSAKLKTIVEAAREKGLATGLITMGDDITGATPSAFATHVPDRSMYQDIASQYVLSDVNILIGSGEKYFLPDSSSGVRKDHRNLVEEMRRAGYALVRSVPGLDTVRSRKLLGFMTITGNSDDKIVGVTRAALRLLGRNKKGFFLMVECPLPDHGGHAHDSSAIVDGILQLDRAVKLALDFALKDKHTLVLVTADHETGGLALTRKGKQTNGVNTAFVTGGHTAIPVPLFAFGPHAIRFTGMKDNTEIPVICGKLLALPGFPEAERERYEQFPIVPSSPEHTMSTQSGDLYTAGNIAKALSVSDAKVKKAIQALGIKPVAKKGVCNYYSKDAVRKVKAALK